MTIKDQIHFEYMTLRTIRQEYDSLVSLMNVWRAETSSYKFGDLFDRKIDCLLRELACMKLIKQLETKA